MDHRRGPAPLIVGLMLGTLLVLPSAPRADFVATDPGPRGGPFTVGGPLPGLGSLAGQLFIAGQETIQEVDSVQGTVPGTGLGLGPRFNMDSCGGCHNYPAPGGSSPPVNPQVAVATKLGATNVVPSFITSNGPIRHARLVNSADAGPHGSETRLYTIAGRTDAPGCSLAQPDFEAMADSLVFRIPLQLYGLGLIQAVHDATLIDNLASNAEQKQALGIAGHTGGSTGPKLGRFGWKAQGFDLLLVAAGAYAGEVGVTNALIRTTGDDRVPGCQFTHNPEDVGNPSAPNPVDRLPDFAKIGGFASFLAPPAPIPATASSTAGQDLFTQIGCALCHTPALKTGQSKEPALSGQTANLYSDLALHKMGPGLADGVTEGNAGPDEFRTTPLWGVGLRLFLLHDGRTSDLLEAIGAHASPASATYPASEANAVIAAFNALSEEQKQNVLDFLRSL